MNMLILDIFEKVNLIVPIEQRRFFNFYDDTVCELLALYDNFIVPKDTAYSPPDALSEEHIVLPLYTPAIVDNIIFLAGGGENYKNEFLRKAREANLKYWNENAKGKKIKVKRS